MVRWGQQARHLPLAMRNTKIVARLLMLSSRPCEFRAFAKLVFSVVHLRDTHIKQAFSYAAGSLTCHCEFRAFAKKLVCGGSLAAGFIHYGSVWFCNTTGAEQRTNPSHSWKSTGGGGFFGSILTTDDSTFGGGLGFTSTQMHREVKLNSTGRDWFVHASNSARQSHNSVGHAVSRTLLTPRQARGW
jgi:hypothetical protein